MIVYRTIICPYCWEAVEIALDASVPGQEYVEDCSVCCRPMIIRYTAEHGAVIELDVAAESQ